VGKKRHKKIPEAGIAAAEMLVTLWPVDNISSRSMFGGFGLLNGGTMFAIVDSGGSLYFRVDSSTQERCENAGSQKHKPMPYFEVPVDVLDDDSRQLEWAREAVQVAHAAKLER